MVMAVADGDVPCQAPELPWSRIAVHVRAYIVTGSSSAVLIPAEFGLGIGARIRRGKRIISQSLGLTA